MKHARICIVVIALGLALATMPATAMPAAASCSVSGVIDTDTTWSPEGCDPYTVSGNMRVNEGVTLTILPGTTIKFGKGANLEIYGTLVARGTAAARITFTSNQAQPAKGDWGQIYFDQLSKPATFDASGNYLSGSILQYGLIEYAGAGGFQRSTDAIKLTEAAPYIDHNYIQNNESCGLNAGISQGGTISTIQITNNTIIGNGSTGINVSNTTYTPLPVIISGNTVKNNKSNGSGVVGGINVAGGNLTLRRNIVTGNKGMGIGGLSVTIIDRIGAPGTGSIEGNIITENTVHYGDGDGVSISGGEGSLFISGNTITNNASNSGGGIRIVSGYPLIQGNTITGNYVKSSPKSQNFICAAGMNLKHSIDATNNYWGSSTSADIEARIWHYADATSTNLVKFDPFLTAPVAESYAGPLPAMVGPYLDGAPGSYVPFGGGDFPPDSSISLTINGEHLGEIKADSSGAFSFMLSTGQANPSRYTLIASATSQTSGGATAAISATAMLTINAGAPLRAKVGDGSVLDLPASAVPTQTPTPIPTQTPTPIPTQTPLPAMYAGALPKVVTQNLSNFALVGFTAQDLVGAYTEDALVDPAFIELRGDGRIAGFDAMIAFPRMTAIMQGTYTVTGNTLEVDCQAKSLFCLVAPAGAAPLHLAFDAYYLVSTPKNRDQEILLVLVQQDGGKTLALRKYAQETVISDGVMQANPSSDPAPTAVPAPTQSSAAQPDGPTTVATALADSSPTPSEAAVPPGDATPASMVSYLPWVYWGLFGALGLLWAVEGSFNRRRLAASVAAAFSSGKWRIQGARLSSDRAGLEKQLAGIFPELGTLAWEQQISHPVYLNLFEQLGALFQQRTQVRADLATCDTQIQQESAAHSQVKAEYAGRISTAQGQKQAAVGRLAQARVASQAVEQQLSHLRAEQQQARSEVQAMGQRLAQVRASAAPDRDTQAAPLVSGVAALEQTLAGLSAQEADLQSEFARCQNEQDPITVELAACDQQIAQLQAAQQQALSPIEARRGALQDQRSQTNDLISACAGKIDVLLGDLGAQVAQVRPTDAGLAGMYARIDQLQQQLTEVANQSAVIKAQQASLDSGAVRTAVLLLLAVMGTVGVVIAAILGMR